MDTPSSKSPKSQQYEVSDVLEPCATLSLTVREGVISFWILVSLLCRGLLSWGINISPSKAYDISRREAQQRKQTHVGRGWDDRTV